MKLKETEIGMENRETSPSVHRGNDSEDRKLALSGSFEAKGSDIPLYILVQQASALSTVGGNDQLTFVTIDCSESQVLVYILDHVQPSFYLLHGTK